MALKKNFWLHKNHKIICSNFTNLKTILTDLPWHVCLHQLALSSLQERNFTVTPYPALCDQGSTTACSDLQYRKLMSLFMTRFSRPYSFIPTTYKQLCCTKLQCEVIPQCTTKILALADVYCDWYITACDKLFQVFIPQVTKAVLKAWEWPSCCVEGLGMRVCQIQCNSNVASFPASRWGGTWEWD